MSDDGKPSDIKYMPISIADNEHLTYLRCKKIVLLAVNRIEQQV